MPRFRCLSPAGLYACLTNLNVALAPHYGWLGLLLGLASLVLSGISLWYAIRHPSQNHSPAPPAGAPEPPLPGAHSGSMQGGVGNQNIYIGEFHLHVHPGSAREPATTRPPRR